MNRLLGSSSLSLALLAAAPVAAESPTDTPPGPPPVIATDDPCAGDKNARPANIVRKAPTAAWEISLGMSGVSCETAGRAFDEVFALFVDMERRTDAQNPASAVARINAAAGKEAVAVDGEELALVELALGFAEHTDGAFDPTFAALEGLWTFHEGATQQPDPAEIERRRALVNFRDVVVDEANKTVMLRREGMQLGLGGIVKGYTVDKAVTALKRHGVQHFILKTGGEIYVSGNPGGGMKRVGIPDPRGEKSFALVDVRDRALNISSDNDRFFIEGGVRYHHIIDPKTGRPATASRSVSLLSVDATSADALATAIFVMGPKDGLALVEKLAGVDALIVGPDNRVYISSGLGERLVVGVPTKRDP